MQRWLRIAAACAGVALSAGLAVPPVSAAPLPPAGPAATGRPVVPVSEQQYWGFRADGQTVPMAARLGWMVEGWNTFTFILMSCDPTTRTVRIELELEEEDLAPRVTRRIRHGGGTLTLTGRPPTEMDGEGSYWMDAIRSYDEIAPALETPAPWTIEAPRPIVLRDPGAARAFRDFRVACGISDR